MIDSTVMRIDKKSMIDVIHREHAFSDMFVACRSRVHEQLEAVFPLFSLLHIVASSEPPYNAVCLIAHRHIYDRKPAILPIGTPQSCFT
jgi:hypothetical protein